MSHNVDLFNSNQLPCRVSLREIGALYNRSLLYWHLKSKALESIFRVLWRFLTKEVDLHSKQEWIPFSGRHEGCILLSLHTPHLSTPQQHTLIHTYPLSTHRLCTPLFHTPTPSVHTSCPPPSPHTSLCSNACSDTQHVGIHPSPVDRQIWVKALPLLRGRRWDDAKSYNDTELLTINSLEHEKTTDIVTFIYVD